MKKKAPGQEQRLRGSTDMPDPLAVAKLLWQEAQFTSPAIALLTGIPLSSLIEQLGDRRLVAQPSKNAKIFKADDVAPLSAAEMAAILDAKPERVEKHGGHAYLIPDWREKARLLWADPALSARQVADAVGMSPYRLARELGARPSTLGRGKDAAAGKKPDPARLDKARELWADPALSVRLIADVTGIGAATLYAELGPKPGRGARQNRAKRLTKMDSKLREKARKMWDNPALTQGEIASALNLSVTRLRRELGFRKSRYRPGKPMSAEIVEQARKMWTDPMIPMTEIVASTGITEGRLRHVLGRRPFSYRRQGPDPARLDEARKLWSDPKLTVAEIAERSGIKSHTLYKTLGPRGIHPTQKNSVPEDQLELARKLWVDPKLSVAQIAKRSGIKAHILYYNLGRRGFHPNRKHAASSLPEDQLELARKLWSDPKLTVAEIAERSGIKDYTLYKILGPRGIHPAKKSSLPEDQLELARKLWSDPKLTIAEIAERSGIKDYTLYKILGPRGIRPKRKPAASSLPEDQLELARKLWSDPKLTVAQIASAVGISPRQLYQALGLLEGKRGRRPSG